MFLSVFLFYLFVSVFCLGILTSIYGKWALNADYLFFGCLVSFISFFFSIFMLVTGDCYKTYEITNYCTLSRDIVEIDQKGIKSEVLNYEFEGLSGQITNKDEINLFKKDTSKFHFYIKNTLFVFRDGGTNSVCYSVESVKNKK